MKELLRFIWDTPYLTTLFLGIVGVVLGAIIYPFLPFALMTMMFSGFFCGSVLGYVAEMAKFAYDKAFSCVDDNTKSKEVKKADELGANTQNFYVGIKKNSEKSYQTFMQNKRNIEVTEKKI